MPPFYPCGVATWSMGFKHKWPILFEIPTTLWLLKQLPKSSTALISNEIAFRIALAESSVQQTILFKSIMSTDMK